MNPRFVVVGIALALILLAGGTQKDLDQIISFLETPTPTPLRPSDSEGRATIPSQILGTNDKQLYLVTKIIDGDTIEIENGKKIRYIGIDTPELKGNECFANEARDKNKELVEGKRVKLQKDVSETDRYGRLLRFVYTENGDFVNNKLVLEGYATTATFPPDVSKQKEFTASQQEARDNNRGLWGPTCKTDK